MLSKVMKKLLNTCIVCINPRMPLKDEFTRYDILQNRKQ